ncbi:hypothetical protein HK097_005157, partial [Rhizophlyctis rosea]
MSGSLSLLPTYEHLVRECTKRGLGYVTVVRWTERMAEGGDVIDPKIWKNILAGSDTKLILNGGITPAEAEALIEAEKVDAVAFGTPVISTPDFAFRA